MVMIDLVSFWARSRRCLMLLHSQHMTQSRSPWPISFFAILSSHLRGRTGALVRAVADGDKDGFRLWYDLCREYLPTSKQRTLSLAQTLAQYPQFTSKSSMLEQILNFEQLVGQYESSSGNTDPSDLKAATILRCSPQRIR